MIASHVHILLFTLRIFFECFLMCIMLFREISSSLVEILWISQSVSFFTNILLESQHLTTCTSQVHLPMSRWLGGAFLEFYAEFCCLESPLNRISGEQWRYFVETYFTFPYVVVIFNEPEHFRVLCLWKEIMASLSPDWP